MGEVTPWKQVPNRTVWRRYDASNAPVAVVVIRRGEVLAMTWMGETYVETEHATVEEAQAAADARLGEASR